ncbi:MAG: type IV toxin-antitoxin system AbiEi family antitoxin domain-containing protein [Eggerthellaceae bacterium]|jgi:predicted transcriptional regulator of viral defense system|nr:type IV toxin-antitoxin system AbiEi family antitoxin domain-containing protein [Eggerthellaceae bacterium]MDR2721615.1 type IV toxin-antitoxin system AbiEi family antitoxin domain-containing protein [Coriobacteriaceae bacterium]
MTYFDVIYDQAADNYGLITAAQARSFGVPNINLVKMARRGSLRRVGHGIYRLARHVPTPFDKYAEAVTLLGEGSYIYAQSVLAMFDLALVNPKTIIVATQTRIRKKLPPYITAVPALAGTEVTQYEGIPSQSVADAIRTCQAIVMTERLLPAIEEARARGLITDGEAKALRREMKLGRKTTKQ